MNANVEKLLQPSADVSVQRVAGVYAEALLDAAEKQGQVNAIADEFDSLVHDVFQQSPDFLAFLESGAVGRHKKAELLRSILEKRSSALFFNFLMVLNEHERLPLLPTILAVLKDLRDRRARRIQVDVRSAVPLPEDQREQLQRTVREIFQMEPVLQTHVDPDLIGGLIVRVGDWLCDASVRSRLQTLRNDIIARSSHEIQSRRDSFSSANGN